MYVGNKVFFNDLLVKLCDKELSSVVMWNVLYVGFIKREIFNFCWYIIIDGSYSSFVYSNYFLLLSILKLY